MIDRGKQNVLGILIDAVDYQGAVERIVAAAKGRQPLAVSALAVHGVMTGVFDPVQRYRLNQFGLIVPDGQPVRWAMNWLHGVKLPDRVYGPNLTLEVCRRAAEEQLPIFLFGSTPEMLQRLSDNLRAQFPALRIAGIKPSRFRRLSREEGDELVAEIRDSGAVITFIGIGCPRQEVFAYEFCTPLAMPLIAVGAAFAFHAGMLPQAPSLMQRWGLEWLFRFFHEPLRLWKRYLLLNPTYLTLLLLQMVGLRKFDPRNAQCPKEELLYG